jgi:hypothetical protein
MILEKSKASAYYGVYTKEQRNQFFTNHKNKTENFSGASYAVTDEKRKTSKGYFGQYSVDIADESTDQKDLRGFIAEIIKKTGLLAQVAVNVPATDNGRYGYSGAHLEVIFSKDQTDKMMATAARVGQENFVKTYVAYVDRYFAQSNDPWGICDHVAGCENVNHGYTEISLRNMWGSLMNMKAKKENPEAFVSAYADFGRGVAQNAFTLQAALALAGEGAEIYYRVEGSRVSLYELYFATTSTPGQYRVITGPGEQLPLYAPVSRADKLRGIIIRPGHPIHPIDLTLL